MSSPEPFQFSTLQVARPADKTGSVILYDNVTLPQLAATIAKATAKSKSALPWVKLAVFGNVRSEKGSLRHDPNIVAFTGIEADYDGEVVPLKVAIERFKALGIQGILYASPSNQGERHRWRVLAPFSAMRKVAGDDLEQHRAERRAWLDQLGDALGVEFSRESYALSQSYYFGATEETDFHGTLCKGPACIDELWPTPQARERTSKRTIEDLRAAIVAGTELHPNVTALAMKLANRGEDEESIREEIESLLAECTRDRGRIAAMLGGELKRIIHSACEKSVFVAAADEFQPVEEAHVATEKATFWNATAYQARPLPQWLIPDMLQRGTLAFIYGEPGCGKSALAMSLAMGFAGGAEDVLGGLEVWDRGAALYFAMEGSVRLRTQPYYMTGRVTDPKIRFEDHIRLDLDSAEGFDFLHARLRQARALDPSLALCVIDTLARATPGVDENTADLGAIAVKLDHLAKEFNVCMLVIHHSGKDQSRGMRGHSSVKGAVNTEIEVRRDDTGRRFRVTKQREGEDGREHAFHLDVIDMGHYPGHPERPLTGIIATIQGEPARRQERRREPVSKVQKVVWRRLQALAPNGERVPTETLIQDATDQLPKVPGQHDRRRETIKRALVGLRDGFVKFEEVDGVQHVFLV